MSEKEMYLQGWEREHQITTKVLKAYPAEKLDYRPHEKSRTARDLAWVFVQEEAIVDMIMQGNIDFSSEGPKPPKTMPEILAAFDKTHREMVEKVKKMSEADYHSMIKFPVGPNQMGDFRRADVLWIMMSDQIHHRGQLSVYVRLAGGKVPSIYGPSADEPWM